LSGDVETNPGPFNFEVKECRTRGLMVCHLNVRSLLPKIDSLRLFISKNPFDVIALSETWLKSTTTNAEIDVPNYSIIRNDRTDKTGGGTAFYVRNDLPFRSRGDLQNSDIETCWIEIIRPKTKSLFIWSVYRPPNLNIENLYRKLHGSRSINEKSHACLAKYI
jgi:exonuclease III